MRATWTHFSVYELYWVYRLDVMGFNTEETSVFPHGYNYQIRDMKHTLWFHQCDSLERSAMAVLVLDLFLLHAVKQ